MANLFTEKQNEAVPQQQQLASRYASARHNILLIVAFTVVNIILLVTKSNTYFLFSAYLPYLLVGFGMIMCGMYPMEYYTELYGEDLTGIEFLDRSFLTVMLVIAAVMLVLYLLSWIFAKKLRVGWMIFALVFFGIDTIAMLALNGIAMEMIVDIIFHGWVVLSLARGISAYYKLKKLPVEPEEQPALPTEEANVQIEEPVPEEEIPAQTEEPTPEPSETDE